jgi:hypothetical protein
VIDPTVSTALPEEVKTAELNIPLTVNVPALAVMEPKMAACTYSVDAVTAAEL